VRNKRSAAVGPQPSNDPRVLEPACAMATSQQDQVRRNDSESKEHYLFERRAGLV